jgi:very-short-patch-repair endonuclease
MGDDDQRYQFTAPFKSWRKLKDAARQMRHASTPAEDKLWRALRGRRVANAKFRRQHAIDHFIVDFVCIEQKLVVEVDGEIHIQQRAYDHQRSAYIRQRDFRILRFSNDEVLQNIEGVVQAIKEALATS